MKILSVDTSSKNCSVSITNFSDNSFNIVINKNNNDEKTHSQKLMPLIEEMFSECGLSLDDIDLLACCVGPGSFTGIRIGVATVKAFADAKNIPVVSVTSLESLAFNIDSNDFIVPILDAKNSNVYSSVFFNHNNIYNDFADDIYSSLNIINIALNSQNNSTVHFVGDGAYLYKDLINSTILGHNLYFYDNSNTQSSISLAKCACKKYKAGICGNSNSLQPIYLKKSQAERILDGEK